VEREITAATDVAHPDGSLRREAIGWARHPILRAAFAPGVSRVARWNYWCITSRTGALTLLVADVGFLGIALVSFLDFEERRPIDRLHLRPGGLGLPFPETPRGEMVIDAPRLRLAMRDRGEELRVEARGRTILGKRLAVDLVIERPLAHETLNVLVPWDDTRFQLTSKQQALPARGLVRAGGREHRFGPENDGFACLDFGRGRWPRKVHWHWGFASTRRDGRAIGINLGAKWTDGTGVTEDGFVLDGRLHKIADDVDFAFDPRDHRAPWRIRTRASDRVDLHFVPMTERSLRVPLGVAGAELHQMMGRYSGKLVDDTGAEVRVADAVGLAESFRGRW
jgi:hypothetical protein